MKTVGMKKCPLKVVEKKAVIVPCPLKFEVMLGGPLKGMGMTAWSLRSSVKTSPLKVVEKKAVIVPYPLNLRCC